MSYVVNILRRTRDLVDKGWNQHDSCLRADGSACGIMSEQACSFCLDGALMRSRFDLGLNYEDYQLATKAVRKAVSPMDGRGLYSHIYWNDVAGRTKEEVLTAIDTAIGIFTGETTWI
jgi:hypothetical protein